MIEVLRAGFLTSVQDLGRTGFRDSGVSQSGALDASMLRVLNVMVGNEEGAAGIEFTQGALRLKLSDNRRVAWGGGDYQVEAGQIRIPPGHICAVSPGEEIHIQGPKSGARGWLAIAGGIDVPLVLGSRSTDARGNFGGMEGRYLIDGDEIPLGGQVAGDHPDTPSPRISAWAAPQSWVQTGGGDVVLRFVRGSGWDLFDEPSRQAFLLSDFIVAAESDRMGARFNGSKLTRVINRDMLSEAVAPGTIQVPPDGNPLVLLNDCQTTGGYPKIAHLISVDMTKAAQLRAGDTARFCELTLADAQAIAAARAEEFALFRVGVQMHYS